MRMWVLVIAALLSLLTASTDATAQPLTPHFPAWERYFAVRWEAFERRGQPHLSGHVVNHYGVSATGVRLLVESLDASGQIVAQRVERLGGTVPGFSDRYFEVAVPRPASSYRVSVFTFEFLQAALFESP